MFLMMICQVQALWLATQPLPGVWGVLCNPLAVNFNPIPKVGSVLLHDGIMQTIANPIVQHILKSITLLEVKLTLISDLQGSLPYLLRTFTNLKHLAIITYSFHVLGRATTCQALVGAAQHVKSGSFVWKGDSGDFPQALARALVIFARCAPQAQVIFVGMEAPMVSLQFYFISKFIFSSINSSMPISLLSWRPSMGFSICPRRSFFMGPLKSPLNWRGLRL